MKNNIIDLFTDGEVTKGDRTFTRLVGGFSDSGNVITDLQVAELLEYEKGARSVRQRIGENIEHFEAGVHILDISEGVPEQDTLKETLISLGYSKQALTQAKNIYILSKAGFLLYLKFAEGDKAVEVYKDFLEDYFKTKAENESMKNSIEQTLEELKEEKALFLAKAIMSNSESDKFEFLDLAERKTNQIIELEKSKSEQVIVEKLSSKLTLADMIENSKSNYDVDSFSKILGINGLGRNNMIKWMKESKLLMENKKPYQQYMKYLSVIPVITNGYTNYKPLIKPKGVDFLMKRLIKDGKVITKSVEDVLTELEGLEQAI